MELPARTPTVRITRMTRRRPAMPSVESVAKAVESAKLAPDAPRCLADRVICYSELLGLGDKERHEAIAKRTREIAARVKEGMPKELLVEAQKLQARFLRLNDLIDIYRSLATEDSRIEDDIVETCKALREHERGFLERVAEYLKSQPA